MGQHDAKSRVSATARKRQENALPFPLTPIPCGEKRNARLLGSESQQYHTPTKCLAVSYLAATRITVTAGVIVLIHSQLSCLVHPILESVTPASSSPFPTNTSLCVVPHFESSLPLISYERISPTLRLQISINPASQSSLPVVSLPLQLAVYAVSLYHLTRGLHLIKTSASLSTAAWSTAHNVYS